MDTYTMKIHAKNMNLIEYPRIHAKHTTLVSNISVIFFLQLLQIP